MSETPEQYGEPVRQQTLSADERLDMLIAIRWDLLTVGEKLRDPLAALDALKVAQAKITKLIEDASKSK